MNPNNTVSLNALCNSLIGGGIAALVLALLVLALVKIFV